MTRPEQSPTEMTLTLTLALRQLVKDDLKKLEWYGQYRHFRHIFQRSYREQLKGKRYLLVADCAAFPVGRLFIRFNSSNPLIADGDRRAYLYSFQVMEMFRGKGIGTRLIQQAETILKQNHYQEASIAVAKDNAGALRLYRRHQYHVFGEDEGRWRYMDHRGRLRQVHEPCWLLAKRLDTATSGDDVQAL